MFALSPQKGPSALPRARISSVSNTAPSGDTSGRPSAAAPAWARKTRRWRRSWVCSACTPGFPTRNREITLLKTAAAVPFGPAPRGWCSSFHLRLLSVNLQKQSVYQRNRATDKIMGVQGSAGRLKTALYLPWRTAWFHWSCSRTAKTTLPRTVRMHVNPPPVDDAISRWRRGAARERRRATYPMKQSRLKGDSIALLPSAITFSFRSRPHAPFLRDNWRWRPERYQRTRLLF